MVSNGQNRSQRLLVKALSRRKGDHWMNGPQHALSFFFLHDLKITEKNTFKIIINLLLLHILR